MMTVAFADVSHLGWCCCLVLYTDRFLTDKMQTVLHAQEVLGFSTVELLKQVIKAVPHRREINKEHSMHTL